MDKDFVGCALKSHQNTLQQQYFIWKTLVEY